MSAYYDFIEAVEDHGGSLSGEGRDKIVNLAYAMVAESVTSPEPEPMDDDALFELFSNVRDQLDRLTIRRES